jgi:hypothetical protein
MARPQEQVPHEFHAETPLASASKGVPPGNTIRVAIPPGPCTSGVHLPVLVPRSVSVENDVEHTVSL